MRANCAIDFFPSSFSSQGTQLMGLQSANEGFLGGFLRHADVDAFVAQTRTAEEFQAFTQVAAAAGRGAIPCQRVAQGDNQALARIGALLHPFPGFGPLAWIRRFGDERAYSLLGITHTTATSAVMDSIGNLFISPIQAWDAVVCTSQAVLHTYQTVLDHWQDYLGDRLGAVRFGRPLLPVIPLGVDAAAYAETPATREFRIRWRQHYSIGNEDVAILWVGRFHHAQKAHPIPAYLALEAVARRIKARIFFLQAGWFPNKQMEMAFYDASRRFAPSVQHIFLDGRLPEVRRHVWHASDIFLSLSDNLQETFGLTPIEAMAAGLPAVVTDWDGYKDTVRDGIDGLRIPTVMPAAGAGEQFAHGFTAGSMSYDVYCGVTAQTVGFAFARGVDGLVALASDPAKRREMGQAGRLRAAQLFDWQRVIAGYQDLLEELQRMRTSAATAAASPRKAGRPAFPLRGDPYDIFSSYPTQALGLDTPVYPSDFRSVDAIVAQAEHALSHFAAAWRGGSEQLRHLLTRIQQAPGTPARELVEKGDTAGTLRALAWLAKMG